MIGDLEPMLGPRANRAWLLAEFPSRSDGFARSLAVWWGFLWQRRQRRQG